VASDLSPRTSAKPLCEPGVLPLFHFSAGEEIAEPRDAGGSVSAPEQEQQNDADADKAPEAYRDYAFNPRDLGERTVDLELR